MRFDLQLLQNGNAHSAKIVAKGSGVVPRGTTGEYPASAATRTGTSFEMSVGDIAVGATESNLLGSDATLAFEFSASGDGVSEQLIEGSATCTITRPDAPHLDRTINGNFVIARSPGDASSNEVELN